MIFQKFSYRVAGGTISGHLANRAVQFSVRPVEAGMHPPPGDYLIHPPMNDPIYGTVALMTPSGPGAAIGDKWAPSIMKGAPLSAAMASVKFEATGKHFAPAEKMSAPAVKWGVPAEKSNVSAVKWSAPAAKTGLPADTSSAAAGKWSAPAAKMGLPADTSSAAAGKWSAPAEKWSAPAEKWSAPEEKMNAPADARSGAFMKFSGMRSSSPVFVLSSRPILGQNSLVVADGFADLMDALQASGGAVVTVA